MPLGAIPSYLYTIASGAAGFFGTTSAGLGKALPIGRDLRLDPTVQDLTMSSGDLQIVADGAAIRQEADIRMRFFLGEWFLDITQGVPYFQDILVKAPNLSAIKSIMRDQILATVGIRAVLGLDLVYDRQARTLKVTWSADTDLGELIASTVEFES